MSRPTHPLSRYRRFHSAQLNEAEYAPIFFAGLLFLHSAGVTAPVWSTLAAFGQVAYFWPRALVGHSHEGGAKLPPYVPGALARYAALAGMLYQIFRVISS